jgi:autotransporter-associated beta strand protein
MTLNNGTTLQVLGNGVGELQLLASIAQAGTGNSGVLINQTGTAPLFTGSQVRLGGANTFAGGVTLTSGNLVLTNSNTVTTTPTGGASTTFVITATPNTALGSGTLTVNGGSLQFDPTAGSNAAFAGSPTSIAAQPGTFTMANALQLNGTLTLTGTNLITNTTSVATNPITAPVGSIVANFSGAISGTGGITIAPTGSAVNYAFTGASTFTGPVVVQPVGNTVSSIILGTATSAGGQFSGVTSFTVASNSTLTLNNNSGVLTRLNTTTPPNLTLNRANVNLWGNASANSTETFGTLAVSGTANISAQANINTSTAAVSQLVTLNFGSLSRGATGTISFSATNMGSGTGAGEGAVRFLNDPGGSVGGGGSPGTTTQSILPYAFADIEAGGAGNTTVNSFPLTTQFGLTSGPVYRLVRWDPTTQRVVPLATTEYASNLFLTSTSAPAANHRYASTTALPSAFGVAGLNRATIVNSLVLDTNTAATNRVGVSVDGPGTLTVAGGAILSANNGGTSLPTNPSLINVGILDFGATTGYIHTAANLTINSPITGSGGVVKSGFGTLTLNATNPFTGGLTSNSGVLQFSSDANLGAGGGSITLNSGLTGQFAYIPNNQFTPANGTAVTINRPITVGPAGTSLSVTLTDSALTLSGTITGTGQVFKSGGGVLNLAGTNTYTGNTIAFAGVLTANSDAALGDTASNVLLAGGTFQPTTSFSTNRNFLVTATSLLFTNGQNLTINGNITSQTPAGAVALIKSGNGDLTLTAQNTLNGSFQLGDISPAVRATNTTGAQGAGRAILSGANGSVPLASSVFSLSGGEIVLDNTAAVNNNRIGSVTVGLLGGNLTLIGNASAPVNEVIGALSISNTSTQYGGTLTLVTPAGSGQSTTLTATTFANQAAPNVGTLFVRGTNLGATSGDRTAVVFGANPASVNGLIPGMVGATSATSEPTDFLTTQTITVPAPNSNQFALVPFTAYTSGTGALGTGNSAATFDVTAAASFTGISAANAMRIRGGSVDLGGGTLSLTAGAILATGGANGGISNGTLSFGAGVPARFTVATGSDLSVSAAISGTTGGLAKSGNGVLTLSGPVTMTTGQIGIGQGTLRYGAANVLPASSQPFINSGAILDLNNTNSTLGGLNGFGDTNIGTGTLTLNVAATPVIAYGGGFVGSGTLIKTGLANQTLAGSSPNFTGSVQVLAGTNTGVQQSGLILLSSGALGVGTSPILLGDTTGATQASIALGTALTSFGRDITVQAGSTPATPHTFAVGAQTVAISSNISLGQQLRLTNFNTNLGNASLNGTISGAGGINVFFGSWSFNGNNTYQGGTTIGGFGTDTGVVSAIGVGSDSAFGTGTVTFTTLGGNLRADNGPRTLANSITLASGTYFGVAGTNDLTLNGSVNLSAAATAQTFNILSTGTTTLGGVISNGTGGINKNGPGILALTGNNTYSGTTTVNAGTLIVNNTSGSGTGTGNVVVNPGAILGGTGTVGTGGLQTVTVNPAAVIRPGANLTGIGTLTVNSVGNVTFAAGSTLQVNVGTNPAVGGRLNIIGGGTADVSGLSALAPLNVYLTSPGGPTAGTPYSLTVIDSGSTPIIFPVGGFDPSLFSVTTDFPVTGLSVLNPTPGTIVLNFTPVPEPGSVLLVVAGVAAVAGLRRRFRTAGVRGEVGHAF